MVMGSLPDVFSIYFESNLLKFDETIPRGSVIEIGDFIVAEMFTIKASFAILDGENNEKWKCSKKKSYAVYDNPILE